MLIEMKKILGSHNYLSLPIFMVSAFNMFFLICILKMF